MTRGRPTPATLTLALLGLWLLAYQLSFLLPGDLPASAWFGTGVYRVVYVASAALVLVRTRRLPVAQRRAWRVIAAALLIAAATSLYDGLVNGLDTPAFPSVVDAGYLTHYLVVAVGVVLLGRVHAPRASVTDRLDGGASGFAVLALAAAVIFGTTVTALDGSERAALLNLRSVIADAVVCGLYVAVWATRGWTRDRAWLLAGLSLVVLIAADSCYALQEALGISAQFAGYEPWWPAAFVLWAAAATFERPAAPDPRLTVRRSQLVVPVAVAVVGVGIPLAGALTPVHPLAVGLAAVSSGLLLTRFALALRENARLIADAHDAAATDALTGLGNRRQLEAELAETVRSGRPATLVLLDCDGFKAFNDRYGHPAGDALLRRLAVGLRDGVGARGSAHRLGGDEFCALLDGHPDEGRVAALVDGLAERGPAHHVSASHGLVRLPGEARSIDAALALVDRRMYEHKRGRRPGRDHGHPGRAGQAAGSTAGAEQTVPPAAEAVPGPVRSRDAADATPVAASASGGRSAG